MPRHRALPSVDELLSALAEAGVTDAPTEGPEESLRGLLDLALYVAEHRKRVSFPDFTWDDPRFVAQDAKVRFDIAYARLDAPIASVLLEQLPRVSRGHALLALDAHEASVKEFDLFHDLFGKVTLFAWPTKPSESADPRIDAARERGWAKSLKEHNLLPGRGIVVLDEHQGLLLREDALAKMMGMILLLPDGNTSLVWNPFAEAERNDSELQYWLGWGPGDGPASGWKEVMRHDAEGEP